MASRLLKPPSLASRRQPPPARAGIPVLLAGAAGLLLAYRIVSKARSRSAENVSAPPAVPADLPTVESGRHPVDELLSGASGASAPEEVAPPDAEVPVDSAVEPLPDSAMGDPAVEPFPVDELGDDQDGADPASEGEREEER